MATTRNDYQFWHRFAIAKKKNVATIWTVKHMRVYGLQCLICSLQSATKLDHFYIKILVVCFRLAVQNDKIRMLSILIPNINNNNNININHASCTTFVHFIKKWTLAEVVLKFAFSFAVSFHYIYPSHSIFGSRITMTCSRCPYWVVKTRLKTIHHFLFKYIKSDDV